jgi:tetratricopeptide (TPR) repeat protein
MQADYAGAQEVLQESVRVWQQLMDAAESRGDKARWAEYQLGLSNALNIRAIVSHDQGDYAEAISLYQEAIASVRELGEKQPLARTIVNLGIAYRDQGDYGSARSLFEEGLALQQEIGDRLGTALSLLSLGMVAWYQEDHPSARNFLAESLTLSQELGYKKGIADCLEGLARVAGSVGLAVLTRESSEQGTGKEDSRALAAQLWGAAEALREEIGSPIPPADRADYEGNIKAVQASMAAEEWSQLWAEGRKMGLERAMAEAVRFSVLG